MKILQTYPCKNKIHSIGFGKNNELILSFQKRYMTKDTKIFHYGDSEKYYSEPYSWWIILNLFGYCTTLTLK